MMGDAVRAEIIFARYRGNEGHSPQSRRILPREPALPAGVEQRVPPIHQISREALLDALAAEYLFAGLTRAIMEGFASENGARLSTMQAADHNIADKLEALRKQERIVRQESITVELLDIVTGAEATNGNGGR